MKEDVSFSSKGNKRVFVKPEGMWSIFPSSTVSNHYTLSLIDGDDSAMSAYDPYQQSKKTKVYKGITLYDPTQEMSNEVFYYMYRSFIENVVTLSHVFSWNLLAKA